MRMRSRKSVKQKWHPLKSDTRAPHDAKPAWRKSCSTSYAAGVFPSAPTARGSSKSERATARATAQANEPHRKRQACSARRRNNQVSCLALTLASWLTKILVSSDQRPPTSTPATSNRALLRGPTNSGYLRSFPSSRNCEDHAIFTWSPSSGGTVPSQRADDCGVDGCARTLAARQLPPQAVWHLSCLRSQCPDLATTRWWWLFRLPPCRHVH